MKILIYGLHFKPDLIGIGKYTGEMADWLFENRHDIRVISAPHFYPEWQTKPKQFGYITENDPYKIWRCPIYVPKQPKSITRLLHYLSFCITSFPILIRNIFWRPEYIITIEPPFITSMNTILYSFLSGAKSILHIQDLEIDAAFSLNMLRSHIIYKLIGNFEIFILKRFYRISTISKGMLNKISQKNIDDNKILLLPNWADIEKINPDIKNDYLRKKLLIPTDKRIVLYSGNIGEKQNLDSIINIAEYFSKNDNNIQFLIVGQGSAKERLQMEVNNRKISNLSFLPLQSEQDFGALLTLADVHLIPQNENISDYVLPSKLSNILSAGGTAIVSAKNGTQLADIIKEHQIGYLINPNSESELKEAIKYLLNNSKERELYGHNARHYAEEYLSKDIILSEFISKLM